MGRNVGKNVEIQDSSIISYRGEPYMSRMSWCSSLAHWCCVCETPEGPFIEYVLAAPIEARAEAPDGPNPNAAPGGGSDTLDARFNLDALELACDVTDESETRL